MTEVAEDHPLPKPKFTDRERAAWDWLHARNIRPWVVDLVDKSVKSPKGNYASLIEFAYFHGWDG